MFTPPELKKIDSEEDLKLILKKNHKIVLNLKAYGRSKPPIVVAFKLTNSTSYDDQIKAIHKLSLNAEVDYVVHNDFHDIQNKKENRFRVFEKTKVLFESLNSTELVRELEKLLRSRL